MINLNIILDKFTTHNLITQEQKRIIITICDRYNNQINSLLLEELLDIFTIQKFDRQNCIHHSYCYDKIEEIVRNEIKDNI